LITWCRKLEIADKQLYYKYIKYSQYKFIQILDIDDLKVLGKFHDNNIQTIQICYEVDIGVNFKNNELSSVDITFVRSKMKINVLTGAKVYHNSIIYHT
jgi:hypothetical protein